ncbi:hypothetical protein BDV93DRAFT_523291 [Ceratobasidium sp. AG-I]|nr:hypothetical protein BDV93DRAFT_523291 [Ceratobasidium sp. AG-I]
MSYFAPPPRARVSESSHRRTRSDASFWTTFLAPAGPSTSPVRRTTFDEIREPDPASNPACCVCLDDNVSFPSSTPTRRCSHKPIVCTECLLGHVRSAIMSSGQTEVRCPAGNCSMVLAYDDVRSAANGDKALIDRYDALLLRQALGADATFVWCKNPNCGSGQYHEDGNAAPIITCRRCKTKSCFEHDVVWHVDLTCSEYDANRRPVNTQTTDYLQRYTKVCPGCTRMVEKIDGCDHMVCVKPGGCGYEFCWECLADYRDIRNYGNERHGAGCRHRS